MSGAAIFGSTIFGEMANHLWQSTVFAAGAALLALALRRNRAQVRYWVWLAASAKFLVPFSALAGIGGALWESLAARTIATEIAAPATVATINQVAEPFRASLSQAIPAAASAPHATHWVPIAILCAWACGFAIVALMRIRGWLRVRRMLRASVPVDLGASLVMATSMDVRSCAGLLEPGVVGFWRPVLLLPDGIAGSLTPEQLEAVLAHELSHIHRRDNLTALIQMIVEAVFWFYPVVWWIGARLVEERERACDEAVLGLGGTPRDYADAILNVCKMYVESPVQCVAGISGADLKKRVVRIMKRSLGEKLTLGRKVLLSAAVIAAIAAPVVFGLAAAQQDAAAPSAAEQRAQEAALFGPDMKYDVVSIRTEKPVAEIPVPSSWAGPVTIQSPFLPDGLAFRNATVGLMFNYFAYPGIPSYLISGEPDWWKSERYDVLAKTNDAVAEKLQGLTPDQQRLAREWMLQELLANRFKLKVHWETRQLPRYVMTLAKGGLKLEEAPPNEVFRGHRAPDTGWILPEENGQEEGVSVTMAYLVRRYAPLLGRPVVDETGLTGHYDFKLSWDPSRDESGQAGDTSASASPAGAGNGPAFAASTPSGFPGLRKAIQQQLGLELRDEVGPVRVLVIDHVEKPTTESEETSPSAPQGASPTTSQNQDAQPTAQATAAAPPNAGTPQSAAASTPPQEAAQFGPEFKYEVASIKPGNPGAGGVDTASATSPDSLSLTNMPVTDLLQMAYGLTNDSRLLGAPAWTRSVRYNVEAKMDASVADELKKLKPQQRNLARERMLQELLGERFGLKTHWEAKEMPIYELVVAMGGPKLTPTAAPPLPAPGTANPSPMPPPPAGSGAPRFIGPSNGVHVLSGTRGSAWGNGHLVMGGASMQQFAEMLSRNLGREVVDKTDISGEYDLSLQWDPSPGDFGYDGDRSASSPSAGNPAFAASTPSRFPGIHKAIEQQLGLELRDAIGPVRVIVIDHVEKPTEN